MLVAKDNVTAIRLTEEYNQSEGCPNTVDHYIIVENPTTYTGNKPKV